MQKKIIVMVLFLFTLLLTACNNEDKKQSEEYMEIKPSEDVKISSNLSEDNKVIDNSVKISKVYTDLEVENNWHIVPKNVREMTITIEAENVDIVLFWIAPTGTGTGLERELIGYDLDGNDGWSINWQFGDRIFHDHISVRVLGSDYSTQTSKTFNIHSIEETDGE